MKFKRNSWLVLCVGVFISIVALLIPYFYIRNIEMSIIGGADWPTYRLLLLSVLDGLCVTLEMLGFSLIVSSLFCLILPKTVQTHCSLATSTVSLGLSAVGGLGLYCVFLWFVIVSFNEMDKYPFAYPASIVTGMLCFVGVIALGGLYFKARKGKWSISGVLIDIFTIVLYLPTFLFTYSFLYESLKRL